MNFRVKEKSSTESVINPTPQIAANRDCRLVMTMTLIKVKVQSSKTPNQLQPGRTKGK